MRRRQRRIAAELGHVRQQYRAEVRDVALVDVAHQRPRRFGQRRRQYSRAR